MWSHQNDRQISSTQQFFGNAAEYPPPNAAATVRTHDNRVNITIFARVQNTFGNRLTFNDAVLNVDIVLAQFVSLRVQIGVSFPYTRHRVAADTIRPNPG